MAGLRSIACCFIIQNVPLKCVFFWARSRRRLGLSFTQVLGVSQNPGTQFLFVESPVTRMNQDWTKKKRVGRDFFPKASVAWRFEKTVGFWLLVSGEFRGFPWCQGKEAPMDAPTNLMTSTWIKPSRFGWRRHLLTLPETEQQFCTKSTLKNIWHPPKNGSRIVWSNQPFHVQGRTVLREGILLGQWLNFKLFRTTYLVGKIKFNLLFQGSIR